MLGMTTLSNLALSDIASVARMSQMGLLAVNVGSPKVRVSQMGILVVAPNPTFVIGKPFPGLPGPVQAQ